MKPYLIIAILLELNQNKFVQANYLAQKYEISTRTVYRYLDELESAGIPTFTVQGKNGGVGIENNFTLDLISLNHQEKFLLKQSLIFLSKLEPHQQEQFINQLNSNFVYPTKSTIINTKLTSKKALTPNKLNNVDFDFILFKNSTINLQINSLLNKINF